MKQLIYYDIETDDRVKLNKKGKKVKVVRKGTITSVALKEKGKEPVCFTIGFNCKNLKELKKAIKPYFDNKDNIMVAWNGIGFDDLLIKAHLKGHDKSKKFDLMIGYNKFIAFKPRNQIALNDVANQLGLAKDDIDPIIAWKNKEYQELHDYNIKDVELLEAIDNYFKITEILEQVLETTNTKQPNNIVYQSVLLTDYINHNNIELGTNDNKGLPNNGGLNYYLKKGRHDNLAHYDIRSFYPYMIMALNGSSNLNYDNLEYIELSNTDNLTKFGGLYFNNDGTIQVKKENGKFIGIKLKEPINLKDGVSDIKELTSQLVEYKNNTDGNLRQTYKILVNSLYGNCFNDNFDYRHYNLASAVTFMCRLVLFNCIKHFKGVYAKTDSIWCPIGVSEKELNKYSATLLNKYGLNIYDKNGSYLIQWELEAKPDILYIKDFNNYVELINNEWYYKGSFRVQAQRNILKEFIANPSMNVKEWVENDLANNNIYDYASHLTLSSKQTNHFKFNTVLSDELGLPYKWDYKVWNYYSDEGYINTQVINDKCPPVNFDYALNLCTEILSQYGFNVKVHKFKDNRPKKTKNKDKVTNTTLDKFNTFNSLHDVIKAIYEPHIEQGHRCNVLNMAMVGTAARMGYDVRGYIDHVRHVLGADSSDQLTYNIPLKTDGYGFNKLLEYTDRNTALEYERLIKLELKPIKTKTFKIDDFCINYIDMKSSIRALLTYFTDDRVRNAFKFDDSFNFHFLQESLKVDFNNKANVNVITNINKYFLSVYDKLLSAFYYTDDYLEAKNKDKPKLKRDFVENELEPFIIALKDAHKEHMEQMFQDVPSLKFNELVNLFIKLVPNYYYKDIQEIRDLLTIALIVNAPLNLILEILAPSGAGKGAQDNILTLLYNNLLVKDSFTEKEFIARVKNNTHYYNGQHVIIEDMGANRNNSKVQEYVKALEDYIKQLVSNNKATYEKIDTSNNKDILELKINTPNGFKCIHYAVNSVVNWIKDGGQVKARTETIHLTNNTQDIQDSLDFMEINNTTESLDFNIFKLAWLKFVNNIKPVELTRDAYRIILETCQTNNQRIDNKHLLKKVRILEPYLLGAYGSDYFDYRFKPLYMNNVNYKEKALQLLDIIQKHVEPLDFDERDSIDEYEIAKSKTSISQKSNYERKRGTTITYKGFTIESLQGIKNNKFIKTNYNRIDQLIYWLVQQGYLYTEEKTKQGKNIYILVD